MKKLDVLILAVLHRISERTYRSRLSLDNYALGTAFIVLAVITNIGIAIVTLFAVTPSDVNFPLTPVRGSVPICAAILFGGASVGALVYRKALRDGFQLRYDLGKYGRANMFGMAVRWILVCVYVVSLAFGETWWSMLDVFLLSVGLMFLSCPPPDMNLRLRKSLLD